MTDLTLCLTATSNCSRRTCRCSCSSRLTHSGLLRSDRRSSRRRICSSSAPVQQKFTACAVYLNNVTCLILKFSQFTDEFSASPVCCERTGSVRFSPGVFCVSKSGETNQVLKDVMKSWSYQQSVMESCWTRLFQSEQQERHKKTEKLRAHKCLWIK